MRAWLATPAVCILGAALAAGPAQADDRQQEFWALSNWEHQVARCIGKDTVKVVVFPNPTDKRSQAPPQARETLFEDVARVLGTKNASYNFFPAFGVKKIEEVGQWYGAEVRAGKMSREDFDAKLEAEKSDTEFIVEIKVTDASPVEDGKWRIAYTLSGHLIVPSRCEAGVDELVGELHTAYEDKPADVDAVLQDYVKSLVDGGLKPEGFVICESGPAKRQSCDSTLEAAVNGAITASRSPLAGKRLGAWTEEASSARCAGADNVPALNVSWRRTTRPGVLRLQLVERINGVDHEFITRRVHDFGCGSGAPPRAADCPDCRAKLDGLAAKLGRLKSDSPLRERLKKLADLLARADADAEAFSAADLVEAGKDLDQLAAAFSSLVGDADSALAAAARAEAQTASGADAARAELATARRLRGDGQFDAALEHANRAVAAFAAIPRPSGLPPCRKAQSGAGAQLVRSGGYNLQASPRGRNFAAAIAGLAGDKLAAGAVDQPFCIFNEPVSYRDFQVFLNEAGGQFGATVYPAIAQQNPDAPVAYVRYEEAAAYAKWRSGKDGVAYSLPTAEQALAAYASSLGADRQNARLADSLDGENRAWLQTACLDGRQLVIGSVGDGEANVLAQCLARREQNVTTGLRLVFEPAN